MKLITLIKRFKNFMKFGGETYIEINQIHKEKLLEEKNIVITGGTSGIGYEIAKKCINLGANVLITGRDKEKLENAKKELNCEVLEWDISDVSITKEKVQKIIEIFNGKIDCFINNAGIYKEIRYNDCKIEDWNKIINTNLTGLYFSTIEIINQCFEPNKKGNVIMIASNRGIVGDDGPYGISKAGVINFAQGLAKKLLNKNIRVNVINPGMTASNINKINDNDNLFKENLKGKRVICAKEIADIAVFLISDSSSCITGQVINCDNGETLL